MKLDTRCILCGRLDKDGVHMVWKELKMDHIRVHMASVYSANKGVEEMLKLKKDIRSKVITLLYL
jgi:hypothetical protein